MAISQAMCTSFKAELMLAVHDFRNGTGDTFKLALYTSSATINANTTAYLTTNETTGTNYTAGGANLTNTGVAKTETSVTAGTGFTVGVVKEAPQLEQKVASSLFDAAHCGQDLTIIIFLQFQVSI